MADLPTNAPPPTVADRSDARTGGSSTAHFPEPGVRTIHALNWPGTKALLAKEIRRFMKVQTQTVWAPALTTLLYLVIFTVALGRAGREVMGVPFAQFIAPGLIVMGMMQNSFANASFSLLVGKIQGTIVDYLMPPISTGELLFALVGASVVRAVLVGFAVWAAVLIYIGLDGIPVHGWAVAAFGLLGAGMLGFLGVLTSIWAEKFDHAAAVTNFVVAPLALLSGTFYSIEALSPTFRVLSHANPFFYAISGFRYGFVGVSDSPVAVGLAVLLGVNVALGVICHRLLARGWRIKS